MTRTAVQPARRSGIRSVLSKVVFAAGLVGVAFTLPLLFRLLEEPAVVSRITFENPTAYDLTIEATDAEGSGWLPLGTARRKDTTTVERIIDKGDTWIFRFAGQGEQGGELRIERAQLERESWRVRIPDRIGADLAVKGAPPTP